jgi:hypothetical protein
MQIQHELEGDDIKRITAYTVRYLGHSGRSEKPRITRALNKYQVKGKEGQGA